MWREHMSSAMKAATPDYRSRSRARVMLASKGKFRADDSSRTERALPKRETRRAAQSFQEAAVEAADLRKLAGGGEGLGGGKGAGTGNAIDRAGVDIERPQPRLDLAHLVPGEGDPGQCLLFGRDR